MRLPAVLLSALPAALAVALAVVPAGCNRAPERRSPKVPILVGKAETRTVPFEVEATGTVEAAQSAQVTSRVAGIVVRLGFREGDEVAAGQVLVQIDPRPYAAAVGRAQALLERDRAQAEAARLESQRAEALAARSLLSTEDLEGRRANAEALAATARADSAALVSARLDLEDASVRAPFAGRTGNLAVHVGDYVRAGDITVPLVTLHQMRPILVRFAVPQDLLAVIRQHEGNHLRVAAVPAGDDTTAREGRLVFVDNAVDPATGTVLLKAEFPNQDGALWPGQFARVTLRLYDQVDAVVVPAAAVTRGQQGTFCYVVKPDTSVQVRPIDVERTWRDWAVVTRGLGAGETVVTDGQLRLSDGARATIRTAGGTATR